VIGYGLAAATKPVFALSQTIGPVVAARFTDRLGKGIRGAPRDALIADIAPEHLRGASFGLRQSLDTVGAFLGPLMAIGLMAATANAFRTVFWIAAIPAFLDLRCAGRRHRTGASAWQRVWPAQPRAWSRHARREASSRERCGACTGPRPASSPERHSPQPPSSVCK
jgi:MFS family permease